MLSIFFKSVLNLIFPQTDDAILVDNLSLALLLKNPEEKSLSGVTSFLNYRNRGVRALIHELKYKRNPKALSLAASFLTDRLAEEMSEEMQWQGGKKYLLIPVPMSKKRELARGKNHIEALAEEIMRSGGSNFFEYDPHILIRTKETPPQTSIKNKKDRMKNISGVFGVKNSSALESQRVLLLDDVATTGATLKEAKRVLKEAGAKRVTCIVLAH